MDKKDSLRKKSKGKRMNGREIFEGLFRNLAVGLKSQNWHELL